ncbi:hypothetical protein NQ315_001285 [Exocentrus adspersus]|uniref:Ig-like domain-containing protein n=1 Tax=Exocentrus adspersus TaxID=1586481 RepID=A0AAV8WEQ3_9CUCU|nr:hypothetical protein NQ315_001285 [Exocentrus adspersus]
MALAPLLLQQTNNKLINSRFRIVYRLPFGFLVKIISPYPKFELNYSVANASLYVRCDQEIISYIDGSIVKGAAMHFTCTVSRHLTNDLTKFKWRDNATIQHRREVALRNTNTDSWTVTYEPDKYPAGVYSMTVDVQSCMVMKLPKISTYFIEYQDLTNWYNRPLCLSNSHANALFNITDTLNGKIVLSQRNRTRDSAFVSSSNAVNHEIQLTQTDGNYISKASKLTTHWFVDCAHYSTTNDLRFLFHHQQLGEHIVEALVIADFTSSTKLIELPPHPLDNTFPYVCSGPAKSSDTEQAYGYFLKKIHVKAPISNIRVIGDTSIPRGEQLSLQVKCETSKNLEYCVRYMMDKYYVTGNESCEAYTRLYACDFIINENLAETKYTVVIIIKNEVSKAVYPVPIAFHEVTKAGTSPIVFPVIATFVSVGLLLLGQGNVCNKECDELIVSMSECQSKSNQVNLEELSLNGTGAEKSEPKCQANERHFVGGIKMLFMVYMAVVGGMLLMSVLFWVLPLLGQDILP